MSEINIPHRFITKGFYPEDLPPELRVIGMTESALTEILNDIDKYDSLDKRKPSESIQVSGPKTKDSRRWFHILNPLHFLRLSKTLSEKWDDVYDFCDKSELSTSRLNLSDSSLKIFQQSPFRNSVKERIQKSAGKKYLLKLDISRFYPSIYTHSLEWIIEGGKLKVKDRKNREFLGVALDEDCRIAQLGQTNGIPIGPITSRVISEIVACFLDDIIKKQNIDVTGVRYVDDYNLYFNSLADMEKVKVLLDSEMNKLNLSLNEAKTEIVDVPEIFEADWVRVFRTHKFSLKESSQQNELITLFSLSFDNAKKNKRDSSIKYLLTTLTNNNTTFTEETKKLVFQLTRHSIQVNPRNYGAVFKLLEKKCSLANYGDLFFSLFGDKLVEESELGHTYETLWMLHGCLKTKRKINGNVIKNLIQQDDVLCLTYALLLAEHDLVDVKDKKKIINHVRNQIKSKDNQYLSKYWIIKYEFMESITISESRFDKFFDLLSEKNINFIERMDTSWEDILAPSYPEQIAVEEISS